jgi:hypothetical protein
MNPRWIAWERTVTSADIAAADPVLIRCPACGASETADPAVLTDAPMIVCRNCGETWPAGPRRTTGRSLVAVGSSAGRRRLLEAERRPLVAYSAGADDAWAAKMAGDVDVAPSRRSPLPTLAAATAAFLFLAAFVLGRAGAVAALPDLAGLYAALGMPVNLDGLAIEDLSAERTEEGLVARGVIRNPGAGEAAAAPLVAVLRDSGGTLIGSRRFDPPIRMIAAGEAAPFEVELLQTPDNASELLLRFGRPAEDATVAGAAPLRQ